MILRGAQPAPWTIVLVNTVIKLGLVLLAEGLARFTWIGVSLLIFQVTVWSVAISVDPSDIAVRIHSSTFFTLVMMSAMCLTLARDRTQPPFLRWVTIGVLVHYMAASLLHSIDAYLSPSVLRDTTVLNDRNAWYLLQGDMFLIAFFACLLFMVSWRLSADLREKNDALSREVLERRRLESRLKASLETERALREEQTDLMRVVSHEFRVPLAVIRNAVEILGRAGDPSREAAQERLSGIGEALDRLFSLIDRFMTNDREQGFRPEPLELAALVAEVRLHFEITGRGERLAFTSRHAERPVFADPDMLATVVINLVDNALKYSPDDQPVHIAVQAESGFATIRVCDRGIGIPADELQKIGRRFFRASNTEVGTGIGLGLYNVRKLLAYHSGTLDFIPNEGQGITATVRVPLRGDAAEPAMQWGMET